MKKLHIFMMAVLMIASASFANWEAEFERVPGSAEWQGASWENLIKIEPGLSLEKAYEIAKADPEISYFFHTIGWRMVLDTPQGRKVFNHGDTAFFKGEPTWGTAPGLADGYVKRR